MSVANKHAESARQDYRGDIEYTDEKGHKVTLSWSALCSCTVDALHAMHRYAQTEHKPHLKPDQYRIKKLGIWYRDEVERDHTGARKQLYEAVVVPDGANEPVRKRVKQRAAPRLPVRG